jgi:hypothetical protein
LISQVNIRPNPKKGLKEEKKDLNPERKGNKISLKTDQKPEGGFKVEKNKRSNQKCKMLG